MKPEYQEAIERIDADRKRWMKTELMVDCQISGGMAETLIDEYFGKRENAPTFWIAKSRLEKVLSGEIGWPHVYTTDQSKHFECVPLFISGPTPAPAPHLVGTVDCPCTTFEQGEDCPVGYPSLLCTACDGKGIAPIDKIVALAAEMMKVAAQVGEPEDPFAAWETIDLVESQRDRLRDALEPFAEIAGRFDGLPVSESLPQQCWLTPDSLREARSAFANVTNSGCTSDLHPEYVTPTGDA